MNNKSEGFIFILLGLIMLCLTMLNIANMLSFNSVDKKLDKLQQIIEQTMEKQNDIR